MISTESFSTEWIMSHRSDKRFSKANPPVLEKMIRALSLLEALVQQGLQFTFKGGTCLILLLPEPRRFSVDIDILTKQSREEIEKIFDKVVKDSEFEKWELDEPRSYKEGIPKAHYFFYFNSVLNKAANYILLDILFEEHPYPTVKKIPILSHWLKSSGDPLYVEVPNIESICGDKLTAFAPNTTGVQYNRNKSLEIVKQLHDVNYLFNSIEDFLTVAKAYKAIAVKEILYRKLNISFDQVLDDTIATSLLIGKTERFHTADEKPKYQEILRGIQQLKGYLMTGNFQLDVSIESAAKAAYIAAKIKKADFKPLELYTDQQTDFQFEDQSYNSLNRLRKIRNGSLFYWSKTAEILEIK